MAFKVPVVDLASLSVWCELHLGSPAAGELFQSGHLARVIEARLADGREVVVKVRPLRYGSPPVPRCSIACTCPAIRAREPLAGPARLGEYEATAESYVPGGVMLPYSGRAAQPFAAALRQLVHLAPSPGRGALAGARSRVDHVEP